MSGRSFYFDPDSEGIGIFMGPVEASLMELAWKHETLTVKKALRLLGPDSTPAYTTVMTVLTRLTDKGLLTRERDGRNYIYRPIGSRRDFVQQRLDTIHGCLRKNFGNES